MFLEYRKCRVLIFVYHLLSSCVVDLLLLMLLPYAYYIGKKDEFSSSDMKQKTEKVCKSQKT